MNIRLYLWQRATAALLVPLIIGHLLVIFYASRKGLSAADILARTRGSVAWALYYGAFVLASAIHAGIGLRNIAREWGPQRLAQSDRALDALMWGFGVLLTGAGFRAVYAVIS
jgi:fumarate reductase subunit C